MKAYPYLLIPLRIGKLLFRNRLCMSPLTSDNRIVNNRPSDQSIAFYAA